MQPVAHNTHTLSSWLHWIRRLPAIFNMAGQEDPVQREIHQDWANREYIEVITSSIKKIADFLNSFGKYLGYNLTKENQSSCVERLFQIMLASTASCLASCWRFLLPLPVSC